MKKGIVGLIFIYIAIVSAVTEESEDYRFTKEGGRVFAGILTKGKNLKFTVYHNSSDHKSSHVTVADLQRTCGPYEKKYEILKHSQNYAIDILPLDQDKVLVYPYTVSKPDKSNIFFDDVEIVDLSSCKVSHISLPGKTKETVFDKLVAIDDNSFDIAFRDPALCGDKICRQTYDFQGKSISAPTLTPYGPFTVIPRVDTIGSLLRSDGEIAIGEIHGKTVAFLVKDGFKMLQQFARSEYFPVVATENNLITFADQLNSKALNITQFDLNGNLKYKTVLNFDYTIRQAYSLSTPNSVYVVASECDVKKCSQQETHYVVKKIDKDGKEIGSLVLEFPTADLIKQVNFYQTPESYCISRLQEYSEEIFTKVVIVTKCFNDADFSK